MDAVAEAGYSAVEVMLAQNPATRDPERIARYAAQSGLDVPVVHGPYLLVLRTVLGVNYIEKTQRALELTAAMGAKAMVAHAPFRWEKGAREWLANDVEGIADEHGVAFAMENLFPVGGRTWSSVVTPAELTAFRHVVFDTSHFAVSRHRPLRGLGRPARPHPAPARLRQLRQRQGQPRPAGRRGAAAAALPRARRVVRVRRHDHAGAGLPGLPRQPRVAGRLPGAGAREGRGDAGRRPRGRSRTRKPPRSRVQQHAGVEQPSRVDRGLGGAQRGGERHRDAGGRTRGGGRARPRGGG